VFHALLEKTWGSIDHKKNLSQQVANAILRGSKHRRKGVPYGKGEVSKKLNLVIRGSVPPKEEEPRIGNGRLACYIRAMGRKEKKGNLSRMALPLCTVRKVRGFCKPGGQVWGNDETASLRPITVVGIEVHFGAKIIARKTINEKKTLPSQKHSKPSLKKGGCLPKILVSRQ